MKLGFTERGFGSQWDSGSESSLSRVLVLPWLVLWDCTQDLVFWDRL